MIYIVDGEKKMAKGDKGALIYGTDMKGKSISQYLPGKPLGKALRPETVSEAVKMILNFREDRKELLRV